jgi:hypothetical protein
MGADDFGKPARKPRHHDLAGPNAEPAQVEGFGIKRASKVASTSTGAQTPKGAGTESPRAATATPKASNISNRTVATEPTTPGQKRLSLGDLKRAAAARKAMR